MFWNYSYESPLESVCTLSVKCKVKDQELKKRTHSTWPQTWQSHHSSFRVCHIRHHLMHILSQLATFTVSQLAQQEISVSSSYAGRKCIKEKKQQLLPNISWWPELEGLGSYQTTNQKQTHKHRNEWKRLTTCTTKICVFYIFILQKESVW